MLLRRVLAPSLNETTVSPPLASPRQRWRRGSSPHAVIIVENMTVPPDRRVWQQALALRDDGWRVTVITPQVGRHTTPRETIEGIQIRRHALPCEARGLLSYILEYGSALTLEATNLVDIGLDDIDIVQICNPPDFLFMPALLAKRFGNARIIFDHHDLTPELLLSKIKSPTVERVLMPFARWAQSETFKAADRVISTNQAFRDIAMDHGKERGTTDVVYSGPDLERLRIVPANPALRKGADILLFWVGIMGSQDGLDLLIDALALLHNHPQAKDQPSFHLLIAGSGPEREAAEAYAHECGVADLITFAGFLTGDELAEAFATADIGIGSDPKNSFNDRLAMNKVMEYMAYSVPTAMFDLTECRRIAGEAAIYAMSNEPSHLAEAIRQLLVSPQTRVEKGAVGRKRIEEIFAWAHQKETYLNVYRDLLSAS
ncbi:MAG: glycosyltransferase family 4 protein [Pseudomonadota bacterium]